MEEKENMKLTSDQAMAMALGIYTDAGDSQSLLVRVEPFIYDGISMRELCDLMAEIKFAILN